MFKKHILPDVQYINVSIIIEHPSVTDFREEIRQLDRDRTYHLHRKEYGVANRLQLEILHRKDKLDKVQRLLRL